MNPEQLLQVYVLSLGIFLISVAGMELIAPFTMFQGWRRWVSHRIFPLYGVSLVIMGFPLTQYRHADIPAIGYVVFAIGLVVVFSGPFILLYPEKIRAMVSEIAETAGEDGVRRLVFIDAAMRLIAGGVFVYSYFA